jgi:hypothetical protein
MDDEAFDPGADPTLPFPHDRPTEDERLLANLEELDEIGRDAWRVFRIMGEFVEGFEEMGDIGTGVSIFGSARTAPGDPTYAGSGRLSHHHGGWAGYHGSGQSWGS